MSVIHDLEVLSREDLIERWTGLVGGPPPARLRRATLIRILACELQWEASGQARPPIRRQLESAVRARQPGRSPTRHGTRLVREWNGREHVVDVTEDGYCWNGKTWRSLSAIAREITGARWSGPRFFGVAT
jgi:hypothetical protein